MRNYITEYSNVMSGNWLCGNWLCGNIMINIHSTQKRIGKHGKNIGNQKIEISSGPKIGRTTNLEESEEKYQQKKGSEYEAKTHNYQSEVNRLGLKNIEQRQEGFGGGFSRGFNDGGFNQGVFGGGPFTDNLKMYRDAEKIRKKKERIDKKRRRELKDILEKDREIFGHDVGDDVSSLTGITGLNSIDETQIKSVSELVDQMMNDYNKTNLENNKTNLILKVDKTNEEKNKTNRLTYVYPIDKTNSFHIVAENQIEFLESKWNKERLGTDTMTDIEKVDWSGLGVLEGNRNIILHPFLYPFASQQSFLQNSRNFARLLGGGNKIGGFDVADSDRISNIAVQLINKIDLIIVPSEWVRNSYINSGVTIPVEVLPHGLGKEFLVDTESNIKDNIESSIEDNTGSKYNEVLDKLENLKKKGKILVLYFLIHSPNRKGADLVKRVMKRIQRKFEKKGKDVVLVLRSGSDKYFQDVEDKINYVLVDTWLNNKDLVALYDICDICLVPSRGGGFEINALEAASRGLVTLVTGGGCFTDMIKEGYYIPINVDKDVSPLIGNPIHTGLGPECSIDDFEIKLEDAVNRLEYWKDIFRNRKKDIREKYSWSSVTDKLDMILKRHGFI